MENNEYYQYEGGTTETVYESESLIEYVEEDDYRTAEQHDCSAVNNATALKTHDISAQDTAAENKDYENNLRLFVAQQNDALGSSKISRKQEKKYQCAECDKKFSTSTSLQTHSRSHNAKPGKGTLKIHDAQQLRTLEQALPAGAKTQYNDMNKFSAKYAIRG
ncbi:unnamed protein product [Ceratitis capitata]|uniref:(Mediterranean fruit fly) hypothetical protein n=1 Tax=Ceratitis capitata TaxID=7213 RepID=A0A811V9T0_CERCA|nr:unnamed protein product [Ceratitis capitata]